MLNIPANVCVYLCRKPTDMRKGFDGLYAMVLQVFERDPLDGHLFLFGCNRQSADSLGRLRQLGCHWMTQ